MKNILGASAVLCALLLVGAGCAPASDDYSATDDGGDDGAMMQDDGAMMDDGGDAMADDSMMAGSLADCPVATELSTFESTDSSVVEGGPFDAATFTHAVAKESNGKVTVYISNKDIPANKFGTLVSPINEEDPAGTGAFILVMSNGLDAAGVGTYDPTAGYGQPYWVTGSMLVPVGKQGTEALLGMNSGSAEIVAMDDSKVCGTFDLSGNTTEAVGSFVATF